MLAQLAGHTAMRILETFLFPHNNLLQILQSSCNQSREILRAREIELNFLAKKLEAVETTG